MKCEDELNGSTLLRAEPFAVGVGTGERARELPAHLVELSETWALWRTASLRGAGFPAAQALALAAPSSTLRAVEQLLDAEERLEQTRSGLLEALRGELESADGEEARGGLRRARRRLRAGKEFELPSVGPGTLALFQAYEEWRVASSASEQLAAERFDSGMREVSRAIHLAAGSEPFRRAVAWQNRSALHGSLGALLKTAADGGARGTERRRREELVANYLQRYCVKNDTIGFFGPVGWARLAPDSPTDARPGARLVAESEVYFEAWGMDALAKKIAENRALRPWLAPRRLPYVYFEGRTLYLPGAAPAEVSAMQAALLAGCDGRRTAKQLASALVADPACPLRSVEALYKLLEYLSEHGMITWTLALPLELYPERTLRRLLERVEDERLRRTALEPLEELERARAAVRLAAKDADALDRALAELEARFTERTGLAATRHAGETYAARTLVYEDCRRDIEVNIGAEVIEGLRAPLSLLLTSARWFTHEAAAVYRQAFKLVHTKLARQTGSREVDALTFWTHAEKVLYGDAARALERLGIRFQERWAEALRPLGEGRRLAYRSVELRERVERQFAAPRPGWRFARYHSPDVMVAAESVEAIRRGEFQLVLGELHMATNTLRASFFVSQHPDPSELFEAMEADVGGHLLLPIPSKQWLNLNTRTSIALAPRDACRLEVATDSLCADPSLKTLPVGAFVVEEAGEGMVVRTRDGRERFDILDVFADLLTDQAINYLKILRPAPHTPRVSIDRLVVSRETWRFAPEQLSFASERDPLDRFVGARRFRRRRSLPNHVFVKVASETKPFYVDFDSPVLVDSLAKAARREAGREGGGVVTISEMLPGPGQWWLADSEGCRYTSELRLIALDLKG